MGAEALMPFSAIPMRSGNGWTSKLESSIDVDNLSCSTLFLELNVYCVYYI